MKTVPEKDLTEILNQYKIPQKTPIIFIRESADNSVYCIGEKDKKILRVSKRLPLSDVKFEYEAMEHLAGAGVLLPQWIKTKNGRFFSSTPEITTAVLFEFLNGVHAERTKERMPTLVQAKEAGRTLALLHNAGRNFVSSSPRTRNIFSELERVIASANIFINDFDGGRNFVEETREAVEFAKNNPEPKGFIHNDYRVGNVFFQMDNRESILGVIDFDWGCVGPLFKDVALAVVEWSFASGTAEPDQSVFDSFLEGYNFAAMDKISRGNTLYNWIWFSGLSDTATWLCDNLETSDFIKKVSRSHMYQKAQYFKKLVK